MDRDEIKGQRANQQQAAAAAPPLPQQRRTSLAARQLPKPRLLKSTSEQSPSSSDLLMWMNSNSKYASSSPRRQRTNSDFYGSPSLTTNKVYTTRPNLQHRPSQRIIPSDYQNLPPRSGDARPRGGGPFRSKSTKAMTKIVVGDEEEAEGHVIRELEHRRRRAMTSDAVVHAEGWSSAVEGEQPPLGRQLPFNSMYQVYHDDDDEERQLGGGTAVNPSPPSSSGSQPRLAEVVSKVRRAIKAGLLSPARDSSSRKVMLPPHSPHTPRDDDAAFKVSHGIETHMPVTLPLRPSAYHSISPAPPLVCAPAAVDDEKKDLNKQPFESVLLGPENHTHGRTTDADRMLHGVLSIEQVFLEEGLTDDDDDYPSSSSTSINSPKNEINDELTPLNPSTPIDVKQQENQPQSTKTTDTAAVKRRKKLRVWKAKWQRRWRSFFRRIGLNNSPSWDGFLRLLLQSFALTVGVPSFIASIIVFYTLGTISLDFLPGNANLVWWMVFLSRQCVTLDLARISQWFLVDCVALRSRLAVLYLGPLVTLWAIQSHGWPFLFTAWSLLNMVLLLGRNQFQLAWLFVFWEPPGLTNAMLDSEGEAILASDFYFRALLAMFVAGVATSAKRTSVAMYFGRKTLLNYRTRLEKLLEDMSIVEEVAQLAYEADTVAAEIAAAAAMDGDDEGTTAAEQQPFTLMKSQVMKRTISAASDGKWHSMTVTKDKSRPAQFDEEDNDDDDDDAQNDSENASHDDDGTAPVSAVKTTISESNREVSQTTIADSARSVPRLEDAFSFDMSASDDLEQELDEADDEDYKDDCRRIDSGEDIDDDDNNNNNNNPEWDADARPMHRRTMTPMTSSTTSLSMSRIKNLLERWEEPVNKQDKSMDASIHDILKFRKALTYMDEAFPFSIAFGPASTRNECIKSSQRVYRRLLKLSSVPGTLSFDVLKVLSLSDDGDEDEAKTRLLRRLFRPDVRGELPLLAFVQSCDVVYKRLRFFRASVGNSSVIDKVLQDIFDVVYFFALTLLTLSMLKFNPWPLLVSISTLMVSFAFAVGTSTSKLVEGILLIAARRPYDLGDRIVINHSEDVTNHGVSYSWIVEDINLFTTTLRFGSTNEVATVSNGSIASSRIVNCQRSRNALVALELRFALDASEAKMEQYQAMLEQYIRERPRTWDSFGFFRCDTIDTGMQMRTYTLQARHVKTWQDAQQIMLSRSELLKFCIETGDKMKVNFEIIHNQINYDGGQWEGPKFKSQRHLFDLGPSTDGDGGGGGGGGGDAFCDGS